MSNAAMSPLTLAHHLRVAAAHYEKNAQTQRAGIAERDGSVLPRNAEWERFAKVFDQQAAECVAFATALEGEVRAIGFDGEDRIELELVGN